MADLGASNIPRPAQNYGQPSIDGELKIFVNSAFEISDQIEAYAFGNYANRDVSTEFFWRNPNRFSDVYTQGSKRLVLDLTADNSGNCPTATSASAISPPNRFFPTQEEYDADLIILTALAADANCWSVNELYPAGYRPTYGAEIDDWGSVFGLRVETKNGYYYDLSASYGTNEVKYAIGNTLNPSLGPGSPTSFRPGDSVQSEFNLNLDVTWTQEFAALYSPLNIAAGLEWRKERFESVAGDRNSWLVGEFHSQGASIGSNGYPGTPPQQAGNWDRSNSAFYLDFEANISEKLLMGLAVRYEDFDDFGSTSNFKGIFRYDFNEIFALRASIGTGFKAPTPGQSNVTRTTTSSFNNELLQGGQIPPTNVIAMYYGGEALTPEEADNLSIGFSLLPLENLVLTLDYFKIDVTDRISIGARQSLTGDDVAELVGLGVPGASDFSFVEFFGNSSDTSTEGIDLVLTYDIEWPQFGNTEISLAWNQTKTRVDFSENPSRRFIVRLQERPENRGILTISHNWQNFRVQVRASYYDDWVDAKFNGDDYSPVCTQERPNPGAPTLAMVPSKLSI